MNSITQTQILSTKPKEPTDIRWEAHKVSLSLDGKSFYSSDPNSPSNPKCSIGLWGYSDDTGISNNGGRPGSALAPEQIRRFFNKITPPSELSPTFIGDYGNWTNENSLQSKLTEISPLLCNKLKMHPMITLGGGHDYGAVDGYGFLQWHKETFPHQKPLIINFDAHLDVRPFKNGLSSGTPFSWLIENNLNDFQLIEIGIQKNCNSYKHLDWAKKHQVEVITSDFINEVGLLNALRSLLAGTFPNQYCYISMDIDVFSQAQAPGCSQSWDGGLEYKEVAQGLRWLFSNKKVNLMGIYEVSPPLDRDHQTSKLAACLMDEFLRSFI